MKKEVTTQIYKNVFWMEENHENVNQFVKAVIVNFGDDRGDIKMNGGKNYDVQMLRMRKPV